MGAAENLRSILRSKGMCGYIDRVENTGCILDRGHDRGVHERGRRIIILAQGQQTRLPSLGHSKCLLPLSGCGGVPLIYRTLVQLVKLVHPLAQPVIKDDLSSTITVVGWLPLMEQLQQMPISIGFPGLPVASGERQGFDWYPLVATLADPGNSSLKGLYRYLTERDDGAMSIEQTVILLGDVLYSWDCLTKLLDPQFEPTGLPVFCGTSDLSNSGGELWGISWGTAADRPMRESLDLAMEMHPPFSEYQPGQMRRWLFAYDKRIGPDVTDRSWFAPIDDYTMDVDLPHHIAELAKRSLVAGADDQRHGVTW